ncbi:MAG: energy transducer TonB, partial [Alphaproteobacteria bacterium]|nr:energy transducer TonB [Alphaproteobacteria bacterium]
ATVRPKGMTPQRVTGFIFAGLIQVAVILALIEGLHVKIWPTPEPRTQIDFIKSNIKPGQIPPPATPWRQPADVTAVKPVIVIDSGQQSQGGITLVQGPSTPTYDYGAAPIGSTHTTPPYPPLAIRLSEEGSVRLHLTISPQGIVTDAAVVRSSGYGDLDLAARSWILAHWRYRPALRAGMAVASTSDVQVRFDLKNTR